MAINEVAHGGRPEVSNDWHKIMSIKDIVHGYISLPRPIVKTIVDCEHFQRLKGIEQTGMKVVYPSASHDRFSHSLGVYHLGKAMLKNFQDNLNAKFNEIYSMGKTEGDCIKFWDRWSIMFWLACLLHDCGHAPFSHALEFIYDDKNQIPVNHPGYQDPRYFKYNATLISAFSTEFYRQFSVDFVPSSGPVGQAHERMSAYFIIVEQGPYRNKIRGLIDGYMNWKHGADKLTDEEFRDCLEFMVRMIIGCRYDYNALSDYPQSKGTYWQIELQLRNCIIGLLNSVLDADNLDYAIRNAAVSGYKTNSIDVARLTKAISITTAVECKDSMFCSGAKINHAVILLKFDSFSDVCLFLKGQCIIESQDSGRVKVEGNVHLEGNGGTSSVYSRGFFRTGEDFGATANGKLKIRPLNSRAGSRAHLYLQGEVDGTFSGIILGDYKDIVRQLFDSFLEEKTLCYYLKGEEDLKLRIFPAYDKSGLSVLQSGIDACNFEKQWIYAHHITTYKNEFLYIHSLERYSKYLYCKELQKLEDTIHALDINLTRISRYPKKTLDLTPIKKRWNEDSKKLNVTVRAVEALPDEAKVSERLDEEVVLALVQLIVTYASVHSLSKPDRLLGVLEKIISNILSSYLTDGELKLLEHVKKVTLNLSDNKEVQIMHDVLAIYERKRIGQLCFNQSFDADLIASYKKADLVITEQGEQNKYKEFRDLVKQLQSRTYPKAMWKSYAEYCFYFADWTERDLSTFEDIIKDRKRLTGMKYTILIGDDKYDSDIWEEIGKRFNLSRLIVVHNQKIKIKAFPEETYILMNTITLRLKDISPCPTRAPKKEARFFYLYYHHNDGLALSIPEIMEIVKEIKLLVRNASYRSKK